MKKRSRKGKKKKSIEVKKYKLKCGELAERTYHIGYVTVAVQIFWWGFRVASKPGSEHVRHPPMIYWPWVPCPVPSFLGMNFI